VDSAPGNTNPGKNETEIAEYDRLGYGGTMNQDWPSYRDVQDDWSGKLAAGVK